MIQNEKIALAKEIGEKIRILADLLTVECTQSDKLGNDWNCVYLGSGSNKKLLRQEYVEQKNPVGTSADNPIIYTKGTPLINNAFYLVDGKTKVWMGEWVDWDVVEESL